MSTFFQVFYVTNIVLTKLTRFLFFFVFLLFFFARFTWFLKERERERDTHTERERDYGRVYLAFWEQ